MSEKFMLKKIYADDQSYVSLGRVTKEELPVYGRNWKTFFNSLICPRKKNSVH